MIAWINTGSIKSTVGAVVVILGVLIVGNVTAGVLIVGVFIVGVFIVGKFIDGVLMVGTVIFGVERVGKLMFGVLIVGNSIFGVLIEVNPIFGALIEGNPILGALRLIPPQRTPNPQRIPKSKAKRPRSPQRTQQHGEQQVFLTIGSYSGAKSL